MNALDAEEAWAAQEPLLALKQEIKYLGLEFFIHTVYVKKTEATLGGRAQDLL